MQKPIESLEQVFEFKNLQPINYLKTFNQMLEYMNKGSSSSQINKLQELKKRQGELKQVKFSKFPLYQYYYQMEGILDTSQKKVNGLNGSNKQTKQFQKFQQQFMNKHHKIVKSTLDRLISDNQRQQLFFENDKKFYSQKKQLPDELKQNQLKVKLNQFKQKSTIKTLRLSKIQSQHKLKLNKALFDDKNNLTSRKVQTSINNLNEKHSQTKQIKKYSENSWHLIGESRKVLLIQRQKQKTIEKNKYEDEESNPIFKKLVAPKKYQQLYKRKLQQVQDYLTSRKKSNMIQSSNNNFENNKLDYPLTERKANKSKKIQGISHKFNNKNNLGIKRERQILQKTYNNYQNDSFRDQYQNQQQSDFELKLEQDQIKRFYKQISISPEKSNINNGDEGFINRIIKKGQQAKGDQQLVDKLQQLQRKQMQKQRQYGDRIDSKIVQLRSKADCKIQEVLSFEYRIYKKPSNQ